MLAVAELESVTRTVKLKVPVAVGVPETNPAELNDRPEGRDPEVSDQV